MPRGGKRKGAGRKPLPLYERKEKHSITLPADVAAWIEAQRRPGEEFSPCLARLLTEHPRFAPDVSRLAPPPTPAEG